MFSLQIPFYVLDAIDLQDFKMRWGLATVYIIGQQALITGQAASDFTKQALSDQGKQVGEKYPQNI